MPNIVRDIPRTHRFNMIFLQATQMMEKLHKMVDEGMAETSWAEGIIKTKFEDLLASEDLKDPLLMGEFDVIKELLEKHPETKQGKVGISYYTSR